MGSDAHPIAHLGRPVSIAAGVIFPKGVLITSGRITRQIFFIRAQQYTAAQAIYNDGFIFTGVFQQAGHAH